jgi:hypothetical protein
MEQEVWKTSPVAPSWIDVTGVMSCPGPGFTNLYLELTGYYLTGKRVFIRITEPGAQLMQFGVRFDDINGVGGANVPAKIATWPGIIDTGLLPGSNWQNDGAFASPMRFTNGRGSVAWGGPTNMIFILPDMYNSNVGNNMPIYCMADDVLYWFTFAVGIAPTKAEIMILS